MARCAACLVLFLGLGIPALTQVEHGQFNGAVTDPTGAVISGARVLVLSLDTGVEFVFRTNEAGLYYAGGLLTGRYRLRSQAEGFAELSSRKVLTRYVVPIRAYRRGYGSPQEIVPVACTSS